MDDRDEFQRKAEERRVARMDRIDHLPAEMRVLVNEYGYNVVNSFMSHGVTKARSVRHLVETVLDEFSPTRGTGSAQGVRAAFNREPTPSEPA